MQHTNHICAVSPEAKYANAQDSIKWSTHIIKRLEHDKKSKRLLCLHRSLLRHHSAKCTSICTNTPHKSRGKYYLIRLHSHRPSKKIKQITHSTTSSIHTVHTRHTNTFHTHQQPHTTPCLIVCQTRTRSLFKLTHLPSALLPFSKTIGLSLCRAHRLKKMQRSALACFEGK